jgi:hypothetical protein
MVTLLPQVLLPSPQICNDLAQFGDQHISRCAAFYFRRLGRCARNSERGEGGEQLAGSIRHCWSSSRLAEMRPARIARRMVDLAQPVACDAVPRVKVAMVRPVL